eukprot:3028085-Amphidinium_carterae.1
MFVAYRQPELLAVLEPELPHQSCAMFKDCPPQIINSHSEGILEVLFLYWLSSTVLGPRKIPPSPRLQTRAPQNGS